MKLLSTEKFKASSSKTNAVPLGLVKSYTSETRAIDDRRIEFTITTDSVDRHGDTVSASGWQLDNFKKNPVVLFGHNYDALPVGKAISLVPTPNGLKSTVEFATADLNPFADQVYRMVKAGFLNATSVGFMPSEYEVNEERDGFMPMDFKKQELLEYSIVPVPANAEALIANGAGIDLGMLKGWAEEALKTCKLSEEREGLKALVRAATEPYGSVHYADPGYQPDGVKRYPIDTEEHVRAAWSYINMPKNEEKYTSAHLASIKSKIEAAAKKFGIDISSKADPKEEITIKVNVDSKEAEEALMKLNEEIEAAQAALEKLKAETKAVEDKKVTEAETAKALANAKALADEQKAVVEEQDDSEEEIAEAIKALMDEFEYRALGRVAE